MKPQRTARLRAALAAAPITALALVLAACGGSATAEAPAPEPAATAEPGDDAAKAAGPIVVEHAQGTAELDRMPERVYSLDWGVTAVLQALGVEVHGVAKSIVPDTMTDWVAATDLVDLGTLHEPDFEVIAADPADLIIVTGRAAPHTEELNRIAPTIDLSGTHGNAVADGIAMARTLGHIFDREAEAEALIAQFEATVAEITAATADVADALVIVSTGGSITAFGPGGRFGLVHETFGFPTAAEITEDGRHGQAISFEFLLETDPEWIFVVDRDSAIQNGGEAAQAVLDNELVHRTQAHQNDRIVFVDTTSWYIASNGIVSLQAIADEVLAALQADNR